MKKRNKLINDVIAFLCCCIVLCTVQLQTVYAKEVFTANKAIIFVVDTSGSMQKNDPDRIAIDTIAQFIYALPSDYKVGLVAYSTTIDTARIPVVCEERKSVADAAAALKYEGYSNAGEGLASAVDLLVNDAAQEKYIIMLSDGETLLENEERTAVAESQYQSAIAQAKAQGIAVHVIGLGDEMSDMNSMIFSAARETAGISLYEEKVQGIQDAVDTILRKELGIKQSTLAIVDANGGLETISARLPYTYADRVRVLITCDAPINNLKANLQAESASQINGSRYSLIELEKPVDDQLEISFEGAKDSRVRVNVIPEYYVMPQVSIEYTDTEPSNADPFVEHPYDRIAQITYTFARADNATIRLWDNSYFDHSRIVVTKNNGEEEITELFLDKGCLTVEEIVTSNQEYEVCFDYSELTVNVIGTDTLQVSLEEPPMIPAQEPPEKPPYLLIAILILCVILLLLGIVLAVWHKSKKKPILLPPDPKPEPSKYNYIGKLNIYITRTHSGYDIPPLSYDLFRLPQGKVVSLYEVLDSCGVKERFPGAETIYLKAGGGRSLIIINNSDCTIMKNREILLKTRSYQLTLDSKVDITFEDEISELAFQYKDVKLSAVH